MSFYIGNSEATRSEYEDHLKKLGVPHPLLGDKIASNPIVHAIGKATGCIDLKTNELKPESGCGKMKARLNSGMSLASAVKLRLKGK